MQRVQNNGKKSSFKTRLIGCMAKVQISIGSTMFTTADFLLLITTLASSELKIASL